MRVAEDVDPYDVTEAEGETVDPYNKPSRFATRNLVLKNGPPVPTHGGSKVSPAGSWHKSLRGKLGF